MNINNKYQSDSVSYNSLERELSTRINHPDKNLNILTEQLSEIKPKKKTLKQISNQSRSSNQSSSNQSSSKQSSSNQSKQDNKMKYITTDSSNFKDFYSFGNKMGQNYNTDQESDLRFSESTRRKLLDKNTITNYKNKSRDNTLDKIDEISRVVNADSNLRPGNIMSINSNLIGNSAAKIPKASAEYWDNTKRRNLDTSTYTNNPHKIQGRGFGDINSYDVFFNGVGLTTRQDDPNTNPRNYEDDRIFLTNHNYHYDKYHVTENLQCGADTRYLNKKMV